MNAKEAIDALNALGPVLTPIRYEDGLPVYEGREAYRELVRRYGIPNAAPVGDQALFTGKPIRVLFVDDHDGGRPKGYFYAR